MARSSVAGELRLSPRSLLAVAACLSVLVFCALPLCRSQILQYSVPIATLPALPLATALLVSPEGDRLYAADYYGGRALRYNLACRVLEASYVASPAFVYPQAVALDSSNRVWVAAVGVADALGRLVVFDAASAVQLQQHSVTDYTLTGTDPYFPPTVKQLAADSSGYVYAVFDPGLEPEVLQLLQLDAATGAVLATLTAPTGFSFAFDFHLFSVAVLNGDGLFFLLVNSSVPDYSHSALAQRSDSGVTTVYAGIHPNNSFVACVDPTASFLYSVYCGSAPYIARQSLPSGSLSFLSSTVNVSQEILVADAEQNLYLSFGNTGQVGRYSTTSGTLDLFVLPPIGSQTPAAFILPAAVVVDSTGALLVAQIADDNDGDVAIVRITAQGQLLSVIPVSTASDDEFLDMRIDSQDRVLHLSRAPAQLLLRTFTTNGTLLSQLILSSLISPQWNPRCCATSVVSLFVDAADGVWLGFAINASLSWLYQLDAQLVQQQLFSIPAQLSRFAVDLSGSDTYLIASNSVGSLSSYLLDTALHAAQPVAVFNTSGLGVSNWGVFLAGVVVDSAHRVYAMESRQPSAVFVFSSAGVVLANYSLGVQFFGHPDEERTVALALDASAQRLYVAAESSILAFPAYGTVGPNSPATPALTASCPSSTAGSTAAASSSSSSLRPPSSLSSSVATVTTPQCWTLGCSALVWKGQMLVSGVSSLYSAYTDDHGVYTCDSFVDSIGWASPVVTAVSLFNFPILPTCGSITGVMGTSGITLTQYSGFFTPIAESWFSLTVEYVYSCGSLWALVVTLVSSPPGAQSTQSVRVYEVDSTGDGVPIPIVFCLTSHFAGEQWQSTNFDPNCGRGGFTTPSCPPLSGDNAYNAVGSLSLQVAIDTQFQHPRCFGSASASSIYVNSSGYTVLLNPAPGLDILCSGCASPRQCPVIEFSSTPPATIPGFAFLTPSDNATLLGSNGTANATIVSLVNAAINASAAMNGSGALVYGTTPASANVSDLVQLLQPSSPVNLTWLLTGLQDPPPTRTSPPPSQSSSFSSSGVSGAVAAAIAVPIVVFALVILVALVLLYRRRRSFDAGGKVPTSPAFSTLPPASTALSPVAAPASPPILPPKPSQRPAVELSPVKWTPPAPVAAMSAPPVPSAVDPYAADPYA